MVLQEVEQERTDISISTCITLQEFLQDEIMLQHAENERRLARAQRPAYLSRSARQNAASTRTYHPTRALGTIPSEAKEVLFNFLGAPPFASVVGRITSDSVGLSLFRYLGIKRYQKAFADPKIGVLSSHSLSSEFSSA